MGVIMKLVEIKGKRAQKGMTPKKINKKDLTKVIQLGDGCSVCFGTGRNTCRLTECCRGRIICLAGWRCLFGLEQ